MVDSGKMILYMNGVKDSEMSAAFDWGSGVNTWNWNEYLIKGLSADGSVKVKNVYWFNRALTASELAILAPPQTTKIPGQVPLSATTGWCNHATAVKQSLPGCGDICSDEVNLGMSTIGKWSSWANIDTNLTAECKTAAKFDTWRNPNRTLMAGYTFSK